MASDWHVSKDRQQTGPFTSAELRTMVASGQLDPDDFVWKEGMKDWVPASKIKGLFATALVTVASPAVTTSSETESAVRGQSRISAALNGWKNLNVPAKVGIASACGGLLLVVLCAGVLALFQGPSGGWTMFANGSLTKAKYDKIKEGMSYAEVKGIIGADGEEVASSKMEGVSGVVPDITTKMYAWKNSNGSNMNAMFQNSRMIQKAQFGLK